MSLVLDSGQRIGTPGPGGPKKFLLFGSPNISSAVIVHVNWQMVWVWKERGL